MNTDRSLMRRRVLFGAALAAVLAVMFAFSAQNSETSAGMSGRLTRTLLRLLGLRRGGAGFELAETLVRKGAHFLEYALLGFLARQFAATFPLRRPGGISAAGCLLCAAFDELHQRFVRGRAGMWQDVVLDMAGALAGILLAALLHRALARRRRRRASRA